MNVQTRIYGGNASRLSIYMRQSENQEPMPIKIRIAGSDAIDRDDLPASLSRPRCGQKTLETVESTPRQRQLIPTQPWK